MKKRTVRVSGIKWERARARAFRRDGFCCVKCGFIAPLPSLAGIECDHIVPLFEGGNATSIRNLRTLCRPCHRIETNALLARMKAI